MEEALVQSAMAEIAMWDAFASGRSANATGFLAIVLAVWVAARFSSVSLEKNVNMLGKVFVKAFARLYWCAEGCMKPSKGLYHLLQGLQRFASMMNAFSILEGFTSILLAFKIVIKLF